MDPRVEPEDDVQFGEGIVIKLMAADRSPFFV
jgi:hypothetical protein